MDYTPRNPTRESLAGIGERLRLARWHRAMRQSDLHDLSGVAKATIHNVETGRRLPSIETICHLARTLDVPLPWFAFGIGPSNLPTGEPEWHPYPSGQSHPKAISGEERAERRRLNQEAHYLSQRSGTSFEAERRALKGRQAQARVAAQRAEDEAESLAEARDRYGIDFDR